MITIDQFEEFSEDYPELAQCYDFTYTFTKDAVTGWDDFEEDWRTHA